MLKREWYIGQTEIAFVVLSERRSRKEDYTCPAHPSQPGGS
jgi:hypothetical protein